MPAKMNPANATKGHADMKRASEDTQTVFPSNYRNEEQSKSPRAHKHFLRSREDLFVALARGHSPRGLSPSRHRTIRQARSQARRAYNTAMGRARIEDSR